MNDEHLMGDCFIERLEVINTYDAALFSRAIAMQEAARLAKNGMGEQAMQLRDAIDESKRRFNKAVVFTPRNSLKNNHLIGYKEQLLKDMQSANTKQKPITFGNGYCALACPYIKPDKPETLSAECLLDGKNIIYQDWFIAHCLNEKHGARNEQ